MRMIRTALEITAILVLAVLVFVLWTPLREELVWVQLYWPERQLMPSYLSVWKEERACKEKAKALNAYLRGKGSEVVVGCVREALRDTATDGS